MHLSKLKIRETKIFLFLYENMCCGYSLEVPEALLMSTHNICFHTEIRKISVLFSGKKKAISGAMEVFCTIKVDLLYACKTKWLFCLPLISFYSI